jgi:hypothetical protein
MAALAPLAWGGAVSASADNLAFGKSVTASGHYGSAVPGRTVDGDDTTAWNSGGFAPEWIEIDLGAEVHLSGARLCVTQSPAGPTTHQITGRTSRGEIVPLAILSGHTEKHQSLHPTFSAETPVRYVRVTTTVSPSWVAWFEIELFGQAPLSVDETAWSRIKAMYRR